MEIRSTEHRDLPGQHRVFTAAIGDLYRRHAFEPPGAGLDAHVAQQTHLLEHDAGRCFVAEEDGEVVAYVSSFARGDVWYLSSLFVLPAHQARGLGKELLARVWGSSERRLTITDAIQPVSNGLYGRRGLIPFTPMLSLGGEPDATAPKSLEAGPAEAADLRELDLAAYGFDRTVDHAYWARRGEPTLWRRGGEPIAYSYAFPGGQLGPIAGRDPESAADALRAELAREDGPVSLRAPGSSGPLVHAALLAGLRIQGPPGLVLRTGSAPRPEALAISGYTLF